MRVRTRKLVGSVLLLGFLAGYADQAALTSRKRLRRAKVAPER
jgi:hypothetical protein